MLCGDIRNVSNKQIKDELSNLGLKGVDIVSAGFPCETFSTAGSTSRSHYDYRNVLYKEAIRIANATNAKILLMENVPAFLTKHTQKGSGIKVYEMLINDLEKEGYVYHN